MTEEEAKRWAVAKHNGAEPAAHLTKREIMSMHIAAGLIEHYVRAGAGENLGRKAVSVADALLLELQVPR